MITPWQSAGRRGFAKYRPHPPILAGLRVQAGHASPTGPEMWQGERA
jgi:hypothetical protein